MCLFLCAQKGGCSGGEKCSVYCVCLCVRAYVSDMYCVCVYLCWHHSMQMELCLHAGVRPCVDVPPLSASGHAGSHTIIYRTSHPSCIAALLLTYKFTIFRDAETVSLSEGFLVCSRTDQTQLQYEASSLYERTFADGYC